MENKNKVEKRLAIWGLVLNSLFLLYLPILNVVIILSIVFLPIGIIALLVPISSTTLGIVGICKHTTAKEKDKTRYFVINIINAVLPIVTIAVVIFLLSTNILVIRFM